MTIFSYSIVYALAVALSAASGPGTRDLIEQALGEPTQITIEQVTLGEAIGMLTEQTGVRIVMPKEAMKLAPNGPSTRINRVDISGMSLREGLGKLFRPMGMSFVVRDDHVEIMAHEALFRLGRPPTWEELDTLNWLVGMTPGIDRDALKSLQGRVQLRVPIPDAWDRLAMAVENTGAGSGDEVLTVACENLGWAWRLDGRNIAVSSMVDRVREQMRNLTAIRFNSRPVFDVLTAVGRTVGVRVRAEPGVFQALPSNLKLLSINVDRRSAEEVFDQIAAQAGLGYLVDAEGIVFYSPASDARSSAQANSSRSGASAMNDPYVGKIIVQQDDGKAVEWLIRRSELPPDLQKRRTDDLRRAFDELRKSP